MDEHCVPRTLIPERLYRVQHDRSFTKDVETGLVASDMKTFTDDTGEFAVAVESHINGIKEEDGSIFISAFASKAQAEDWMCRKWRSYSEGAQILEIETSHLGHGYVYRAGEVAHALEVNVSETTYEDLHNEYLILHIVPARAIIARRARMVTHGLENKDSTGNNSSNATMTERQSPVSMVQPPGQPSTWGGVALSKSVRQIRG
ncbi:hypothetical protein N7537_004407 [Penicillium hordei]|uniref:DUF7587 domain-containing protein n=1 Tax=Penicillium hordei TaxID=40994 RepID=A0AAD6EB88_9EURO|nr:uncharacterized protein N7537_004407 [Penicillium hordei]KAJ5607788.1 hypothetical protein N7537_004407 [Penicillium hordei]